MRRKRLAARSILVAFSLALLFGPSCQAQSPSDGQVEGTAYVNRFFNLSYSWPKTLKPVDTATLKLRPPAPNGNEVLLFSAKERSFGVIIMAERPNFHRQLPNGETEGEDLLEHIKKWWDPAGDPKVLAQTHLTNPYGLVFYELDYTHFGEYMSAIVTQAGDYQIVFRCNANSPASLAEMTKSVISSHHLK